jgi:inhibitor of cysteine peptidase
VRVELTRDDAGGLYRVRIGDEISVALDENPTTGYRWHADVDPSRLRVVADEYHGPERPVGASGVRRLTFAALQQGSAQVRLVKRRPWEQSAVDQYEVAVDITAD